MSACSDSRAPDGAIESLHAVMPVLRHAVDQLAGGDHHG